jgi:hypothetical protein
MDGGDQGFNFDGGNTGGRGNFGCGNRRGRGGGNKNYNNNGNRNGGGGGGNNNGFNRNNNNNGGNRNFNNNKGNHYQKQNNFNNNNTNNNNQGGFNPQGNVNATQQVGGATPSIAGNNAPNTNSFFNSMQDTDLVSNENTSNPFPFNTKNTAFPQTNAVEEVDASNMNVGEENEDGKQRYYFNYSTNNIFV